MAPAAMEALGPAAGSRGEMAFAASRTHEIQRVQSP